MWWSEGWGSYYTMPWMFFGPLMMILFIGLGVAVAYLLLRGVSIGRRQDRAVGILKERYARGEIDQTEFEKRRRFLMSLT